MNAGDEARGDGGRGVLASMVALGYIGPGGRAPTFWDKYGTLMTVSVLVGAAAIGAAVHCWRDARMTRTARRRSTVSALRGSGVEGASP